MSYSYYVIMLVISFAGLFLISCQNERTDETANQTEKSVSQTENAGGAEQHTLSFTKIENEWKVVDSNDTTKTEIEVYRGDTVTWQAPEESDVYFQFMDDQLTGIYTKVLNRGGSLDLTIGEEAKEGDNPYAVFVYADSVYARGESPPRMIVRR